MRKSKKLNRNRPKTSFEKEQSFINVSTKLLIIAVLTFAIIFAYKSTFGNVNFNDSQLTENALTALSTKVDTSKLITNQLSDADKPELIEKIKSSQLDLLTNDEFDYEKYSANTINMVSDITLSSNEVGLIYSYLFINNPDKYNVVLYETSITKTADTTNIKIVASISFYHLFTTKISNSINSENINALPKRIYVTNLITYTNNTYSYSQALINNLTENESKDILKLIKEKNNTVDLDKYIPNLIIDLINNLSLKTNTNIIFNDNSITFKKDAN